MDEKPGFWKFFWAYRQSRNENGIFYIYDKKRGKLTGYKKILSGWMRALQTKISLIAAGIVILVSVPLIIFHEGILFFNNILYDLMCVFSIILLIVGTLIPNMILYYSMNFEKVTERDWNDENETVYRKVRHVNGPFYQSAFLGLLCMYLVFAILFGLTGIYTRYAIDRALGDKGEAEVTINLSKVNIIDLDMDTQQYKAFSIPNLSEDEQADIFIRTERVPEVTKLFINGKEAEYIDKNNIYSYSGLIFSSSYFNIQQSGGILFKAHYGKNTLELKSPSFDKVWTFTVENS